MADNIYVNMGKVKENAGQVETAAGYLKSVPLIPQDTRTTIPANRKCILAYETAQEEISVLGMMLDQEAENIRELRAAFVEFDEMIGRLEENGHAGERQK